MKKIYEWIENIEFKGIFGTIKFISIFLMVFLVIITIIAICLTPMIMCIVCWVEYSEMHQIGWLIGGIITTILCVGGTTSIYINNEE